MRKCLIVIVIIASISSCDVTKESNKKDIDFISVYNGLKKSNVYTKFIGYHIVRRDNENYFMYRDLKIDSGSWEIIVLNEKDDTRLYKKTKLFFERYPHAKLQFDIMKKYSIKAIFTYNYNEEAKRLESDENMGYSFNNYELTFKLSDSSDIANINFDFDEYSRLIKDKYQIIERLDSNWFVLKRL